MEQIIRTRKAAQGRLWLSHEGLSQEIKGTLSPKLFFPYMKYITFLNIIHNLKISFSTPFTHKISYLAENVRLEGPKKQAIVSCRGPKKQAMSLL